MDMERKEADKMTIEEARKQKGMSRREVSEWLEIPYRTLSNWETGVRSCPHYIEKLIVDKIIQGNDKKHITTRRTPMPAGCFTKEAGVWQIKKEVDN